MLKRTSISQINKILEQNSNWNILDIGCGYRAHKNASVIADIQDFSDFYKERKFIRPDGENAYRLLVWYWVTNTVQHFMDELDRRMKNPIDETGLCNVKNYDDFLKHWLPRQRAPQKVREHWPMRLDV